MNNLHPQLSAERLYDHLSRAQERCAFVNGIQANSVTNLNLHLMSLAGLEGFQDTRAASLESLTQANRTTMVRYLQMSTEMNLAETGKQIMRKISELIKRMIHFIRNQFNALEVRRKNSSIKADIDEVKNNSLASYKAQWTRKGLLAEGVGEQSDAGETNTRSVLAMVLHTGKLPRELPMKVGSWYTTLVDGKMDFDYWRQTVRILLKDAEGYGKILYYITSALKVGDMYDFDIDAASGGFKTEPFTASDGKVMKTIVAKDFDPITDWEPIAVDPGFINLEALLKLRTHLQEAAEKLTRGLDALNSSLSSPERDETKLVRVSIVRVIKNIEIFLSDLSGISLLIASYVGVWVELYAAQSYAKHGKDGLI